MGYLDLNDLAGHAERYRKGTHWGTFVHQGNYSLLILNAPARGLEWRPTWRRAVLVSPGQKYRATAWVKSSRATGLTCLALEFYDAAYHPLQRQESTSLVGDHDWTQLSADATAPELARWLRVILHSRDNRGAVWFDDVALQPLP